MRGIILAGGHGTRLYPLTKIVSKQLLPVYDKPMIYYPLSTLMLAGIREIAIICKPEDINNFTNLLGNGSQFGVEFTYLTQSEPKGLPDAFNVASDWIKGHKVCMILGDNIFFGPGLGRQLGNINFEKGSLVFAYQVKDPQRFGVVEFDNQGRVVNLEEKPVKVKSDFAITGLYFFDESVSGLTSNLAPAARGETEILDLLRLYLDVNKLEVRVLPRGTAWLDTGTFESMHDAASFIKIMQERTGLQIGNPFEIANVQGWL
jgi:glucose-1-phosphate thymidylyltransferase